MNNQDVITLKDIGVYLFALLSVSYGLIIFITQLINTWGKTFMMVLYGIGVVSTTLCWFFVLIIFSFSMIEYLNKSNKKVDAKK